MRQRGPLVAGIVSGIVAILAVVLLVIPKVRQVGDARDQLEQARQQQGALETQLRALQETQERAPQIQKELAKLATQIPPTADLPALIRLLRDAAASSGIDFFQIAPGAPIADPSGQFSIIPTQITVNGEFFSLDEFLFRLETLPRAAKVIAFDVAQGPDFSDGGSDEPLELAIVMTVEFYTTDSSTGPASFPGPTQGGGLAPPVPAASPSPGQTIVPTPSASATEQGA